MCMDGDVVDAVDVGGRRIAFQREGRGPPLVLLHGFVGDGVGTWGYQLEALSDACTVIAWDCPGAGHSSAVPESFRLADYADCLSGFLRALDLAHPYVAGLSSALSWR
jgi:pimeloyl-ACP methyl ester carboxylesterase